MEIQNLLILYCHLKSAFFLMFHVSGSCLRTLEIITDTYCFVLKLDLFLWERTGFCGRGLGRSLHVEGPKAVKGLEPSVESLVRGFWRLRVSEAEQ